MAKRTVENELAALSALKGEPARADLDQKLTEALRSKVNLIAARAAGIVGQLKRAALVDEMLAAFERFINDAKYPDRGCTALTAIAKTLYELGEARGEAVFVAGVKHVQKEGSFGPPVDVATELRGVCGLGLVRIGHRDAMQHLVDLLADPEPQVRMFAARGLAYIDQPAAALLVRFKLLTGDRENEVMTECMNALVRLQPTRAAEFLGQFLDDSDPDLRASAAVALGETRQADALELLKERFRIESEPDVRRAILVSVGLLRLPAAIDWLISRVAEGPVPDAVNAIEAMSLYRRDSALNERVKTTVAGRKESEIQRAMSKYFSSA
jgi:HEAT repeat protein